MFLPKIKDDNSICQTAGDAGSHKNHTFGHVTENLESSLVEIQMNDGVRVRILGFFFSKYRIDVDAYIQAHAYSYIHKYTYICEHI